MTAKVYWGKYRGVVVDNKDPLGTARICAKVPDVLADQPSTWAMPCLPMTGSKAGIHTVPPVGAGVWIEFEQGDPNKPIWVGGFWGGSGELPPSAAQGKPGSPSIIAQSIGGHVLSLSDVAGPNGGILLQIAGGAKIAISDAGITIDNGKGATISLQGNMISLQATTVNVNNGALVVS
jgi:uncharacterized protein involved in type VI secretion and phage assembly